MLLQFSAINVWGEVTTMLWIFKFYFRVLRNYWICQPFLSITATVLVSGPWYVVRKIRALPNMRRVSQAP